MLVSMSLATKERLVTVEWDSCFFLCLDLAFPGVASAAFQSPQQLGWEAGLWGRDCTLILSQTLSGLRTVHCVLCTVIGDSHVHT